MLAIEKPKQPKVIKYVWWDGYNKEEVEKVFPSVGFSRFAAHDEDPWCVRLFIGDNCVHDIEGGIYLCCECGHSEKDIFTLSKKNLKKDTIC